MRTEATSDDQAEPEAPPLHQMIKPGDPLPGTRIMRCEPFPWYDGPAYIVAADVPIHTSYTQALTIEGFPVRESVGNVGYFPAAGGKEVRSFLRSSLNFWGLSEAGITDDGTIIYRQTKRHAALCFHPHPGTGVLITHPDRQITADAYQITGHGGTPQVWSRDAVRAVVTTATAPGVSGWLDGWAHLMPDGTVRFAYCGCPQSAAPQEYAAEPVPAPDEWGPECAECGRYESEHDPQRGAWGTRCRSHR